LGSRLRNKLGGAGREGREEVRRQEGGRSRCETRQYKCAPLNARGTD